MIEAAFSAPERFRRGNLHMLSNSSVGMLLPEEVCRAYRASGYESISLTDRFRKSFGYPIVDTGPYRREDFTTIIGAELHASVTSRRME